MPRAKRPPNENSGILQASTRSPPETLPRPASAPPNSPLSIPAAAASALTPMQLTTPSPPQSRPSPPTGQPAPLQDSASGSPTAPPRPIRSTLLTPSPPTAVSSPN